MNMIVKNLLEKLIDNNFKKLYCQEIASNGEM